MDDLYKIKGQGKAFYKVLPFWEKKNLCSERSVELIEGNLRVDHIHMCLGVAAKFSIACNWVFEKKESCSYPIHRGLWGHKRVAKLHS